MLCFADFKAEEERTSARASVLASDVDDTASDTPLDGDIVSCIVK